MMLGGEDPRYICRRLVRAASEDIGRNDIRYSLGSASSNDLIFQA